LNDDSALCVLDAARALGREADVAVVGQGANLIGEEFGYPDSRFIASTAYYPEGYGPHLIELAMKMLQGERVPLYNYVEPTLVTNIPLRISRVS
jgi:ribose transport system substrate-binding protein